MSVSGFRVLKWDMDVSEPVESYAMDLWPAPFGEFEQIRKQDQAWSEEPESDDTGLAAETTPSISDLVDSGGERHLGHAPAGRVVGSAVLGRPTALRCTPRHRHRTRRVESEPSDAPDDAPTNIVGACYAVGRDLQCRWHGPDTYMHNCLWTVSLLDTGYCHLTLEAGPRPRHKTTGTVALKSLGFGVPTSSNRCRS